MKLMICELAKDFVTESLQFDKPAADFTYTPPSLRLLSKTMCDAGLQICADPFFELAIRRLARSHAGEGNLEECKVLLDPNVVLDDLHTTL